HPRGRGGRARDPARHLRQPDHGGHGAPLRQGSGNSDRRDPRRDPDAPAAHRHARDAAAQGRGAVDSPEAPGLAPTAPPKEGGAVDSRGAPGLSKRTPAMAQTESKPLSPEEKRSLAE